MDLLYTFWEKTNQQKNKLHSVPLKKKNVYHQIAYTGKNYRLKFEKNKISHFVTRSLYN